MKARWTVALLLAAAVLPCAGLASGQPSPAAPGPSVLTGSVQLLTDLPNASGMPDLTTGFLGDLDLSGYSLASVPGDENWMGIFGPQGIGGTVRAMATDGSGNLYAGGDFFVAGRVQADNIARWDGSSWSALGRGMDGSVRALAVDDSGNLYAGGEITIAGGVQASHIARWDGRAWSALGSGLDGTVLALAVDGSGALYAGGAFQIAGQQQAKRVARWNGSAWGRLDRGMDDIVNALAVDSGGNLYAGGPFHNAGGLPARHIARWDGTAWSALGSVMSGVDYARVDALALDGSANLYAGGYFVAAGGVLANHIARWDGSAWNALGSGMSARVYALAVDGGESLYAGGQFQRAGGRASYNIAWWLPLEPRLYLPLAMHHP